jgi:hypothetical protein
MSDVLTKVDSAIAGLSISPKDEKLEKAEKKGHKRVSSSADGVRNISELGRNKLKRRYRYILVAGSARKTD